MGICFVAYSISTRNLERVLADPPLVWRVIDPDDDASYLRQLAAGSKRSLLQRLFAKPSPAPVLSPLVFSEAERRILDIDKSWDGLRTCIRACAPDAPDLIAGEGTVGDFEIGYGPALYAGRESLAGFSAALDRIGEAMLLDKLRTENFKDVYLSGTWKQNDADSMSYLLENFRELHAFARHCAVHEQAAIIQLT